MRENFLPALVALLIVGLLVGIIYPWAVETYGQLAFDRRPDGSVMANKGIARNAHQSVRNVNDPTYFWGLPPISAPSYPSGLSRETKSDSENPGSTFSGALPIKTPTPGRSIANGENPGLLPTPQPTPMKPIPIVPIFPAPTPGGELKMDISPEAAQLQIDRIARLRGMEPGVLQSLIDQYSEKLPNGTASRSRVNVIQLNEALDRLAESMRKESANR